MRTRFPQRELSCAEYTHGPLRSASVVTSQLDWQRSALRARWTIYSPAGTPDFFPCVRSGFSLALLDYCHHPSSISSSSVCYRSIPSGFSTRRSVSQVVSSSVHSVLFLSVFRRRRLTARATHRGSRESIQAKTGVTTIVGELPVFVRFTTLAGGQATSGPVSGCQSSWCFGVSVFLRCFSALQFTS